MNWLNFDVSLDWSASIVVIISIGGLSFVYRKQLKEFLTQADVTLRLRLFGIIDVEVKNLERLQKQMHLAGVHELKNGNGAAQVAHAAQGRQRDAAARDAVVESWGRLKQIVRDAAVSRHIAFAQTDTTQEAIRRLASLPAVPGDLANAMHALYAEGEKIAQSQGRKLDKAYAASYQRLVRGLASWLTNNVINPPPIEEPPKPPRRTVVGSYFPPPRPGHPAALLVGLHGSVQGQRFAVESEVFRIGADPENDLIITGDEYVSGKHASLQYDKGTLLLADQHSRNGTFLNDSRLMRAALALKPGDRIRIGSATLEVVQAQSH